MREALCSNEVVTLRESSGYLLFSCYSGEVLVYSFIPLPREGFFLFASRCYTGFCEVLLWPPPPKVLPAWGQKVVDARGFVIAGRHGCVGLVIPRPFLPSDWLGADEGGPGVHIPQPDLYRQV